MTQAFNPEEPSALELHRSSAGALTIFNLPPSKMPVAATIVRTLKERAYHVHLLQGDDRPEGMMAPFGVWPHPDAEAIAAMSREVELPVYTTEELAALGRTALTAA